MSTTFIQKTYEETIDQEIVYVPPKTIWVIDRNKFAHQVFNSFTYNYEISGFLVANTLLGFPKYYSPQKSIKTVNWQTLYNRFNKVIF